jgi:membrane-associated phospholipid phosphatase
MVMPTAVASGGTVRQVHRSNRMAPYGAAVVCAAGILAVYVVFVLNPTGRWLDNQALDRIIELGAAVRPAALAILGTVSVQSAVVCVLAAMLVAMLRRRVGLAFLVAGLVLAANVSTQLLKITLDRPALAEGLANSLPSGHATAALSIVVALVAVFPVSLKPLVVVLGGTYALAVATATVVAGWHRPSDVVAAGLVVLVWAFASLGLYGNHRAGHFPRPLAA